MCVCVYMYMYVCMYTHERIESNVVTNFFNSKADTTPTHAVHQYVEHREVTETNANNKFNEETKRSIAHDENSGRKDFFDF